MSNSSPQIEGWIDQLQQSSQTLCIRLLQRLGLVLLKKETQSYLAAQPVSIGIRPAVQHVYYQPTINAKNLEVERLGI